MLEVALRNHLLTVAPYTTIVGQRIHPDALPDPKVLPATVVTRVSRVRDSAHDGPLGFIWGRWQFDTWAETRAQAEAGARELTRALLGFAGQMGAYQVVVPRQSNDMMLFETETNLYRVMSEFIIWHSEQE